jgi:anion-transporting  ArsA/GET3 family ATPase
MDRAHLETRRFLIVTGKGGVGKTTVCAAEALQLANKGKRVLISLCNAKERLSKMFGTKPVGSDVMQLAERVWAVNMDPERALEEYGEMVVRSRSLNALLFANKYARALFRGVPGMHEWAMLGKAWWHTTEKLPNGEDRFDVVILDAPATGHGLDMLRVPKVILDVVPPGLLRRDAERAWALFRDEKECAIVLVTLPEEMPTTETLELASALRDELKLPIAKLVVNCMLPPLFSPAERAALTGIPPIEPRTAAESALAAAQHRAVREKVQAESLKRLTESLPLAPSFLPLLLCDAAAPNAIAELARRVA